MVFFSLNLNVCIFSKIILKNECLKVYAFSLKVNKLLNIMKNINLMGYMPKVL